VFTLNLEQILSGAPVDSAIGVVQVTIFNAKGLKGKFSGGTPDPYAAVSLSAKKELFKTKVKKNT
jgi:Ca2+-dependent lipid-binding protein